MIQEDFYNIIENTNLIQKHGDELMNLALDFPYASSLQLLFTKSLKDSDAIQFNLQLHNCALKVSDRKRMYEFIHQEELVEVIQKLEDESGEVDLKSKAPEEVNMAVSEKTEELSIIEKEPIDHHLEELVEDAEENLIEHRNRSEDVDRKQRVDELEQLIISEAINYSIQNEVNSEIEEANIIEEDLIKEQEADAEPEERPIRNVSTEKHSFVDWFSVPKEEEKEQSTPRKDKELVSLVDTFLKKYEKDKTQENKEISFYSPENIARLSLVDSEEFVTETLANVYAKQGHFSKAIRIYEQLILINPEKKTFFASRIRFLKEKQQYKND